MSLTSGDLPRLDTALVSEADCPCLRILEASTVDHRQSLLIRIASGSESVARDYHARQRRSTAD
jgi:hypothetical protein